jgi:hypothetical protein
MMLMLSRRTRFLRDKMPLSYLYQPQNYATPLSSAPMNAYGVSLRVIT